VIEEAIANTPEVAERSKDYRHPRALPACPDFPFPEGHTPVSYLGHVARKGLGPRMKLASYDPIEAGATRSPRVTKSR
jgi:DNA polymerase III subunit alpha